MAGAGRGCPRSAGCRPGLRIPHVGAGRCGDGPRALMGELQPGGVQTVRHRTRAPFRTPWRHGLDTTCAMAGLRPRNHFGRRGWDRSSNGLTTTTRSWHGDVARKAPSGQRRQGERGSRGVRTSQWGWLRGYQSEWVVRRGCLLIIFCSLTNGREGRTRDGLRTAALSCGSPSDHKGAVCHGH